MIFGHLFNIKAWNIFNCFVYIEMSSIKILFKPIFSGGHHYADPVPESMPDTTLYT